MPYSNFDDVRSFRSIYHESQQEDGDMDIIISDRKPGETNGVRWMENPEKNTGKIMGDTTSILQLPRLSAP